MRESVNGSFLGTKIGIHATLDVLGTVPAIGGVADVANGLLYLAEGNKFEAGLSFGSVLLFGGAGIAMKMSARAARGAARGAATVARFDTGISAAARSVSSNTDNVARFAREGTEAFPTGTRNIGRPTHQGTESGASQFFRTADKAGGGAAVSLKQAKIAMGKAGMSVREFDIRHVNEILDPSGNPVFGRTLADGAGNVLRGSRGRPIIEITDLGLSSMDEAVATIQHEIFHVRRLIATGDPGLESAAEEFGQQMLKLFQRGR